MQSPKRSILKNKQGRFLDRDKTMVNVQKHNTCTDVPSSQTFGSYIAPNALRKGPPKGGKQNK
jgi:hypothetical protein